MSVTGDVQALDLNAVVCATDFSLSSQNAERYARLLAKYFSCRLIVAHAFTPSQAAMEVEAGHNRTSQQRKDLQLLLDRKAASLNLDSLDVVPELLEGDPKEAIPMFADQRAPVLIVLGTHGGGRLERRFIGSVAEHILRMTHCPCFTVGPHVPAEAVPFRRVLYATDFTPTAAHAASYASSFAERFRTEVDVLHVIPKEAVEHPGRLSEIEAHFYNVLDSVMPEQARGFCKSRSFVEVGKAHKQILRHIRERSVDLLVLGVRKTSHFGLEMGTTGAFQLIVDAPCPVLTIAG